MIQGWANLDRWAFVDVAILLGLGFGVYRSNRTCAFALLAYCLANMAYKWFAWGHSPGVIGWSFAMAYACGFAGARTLRKSGAGETADTFDSNRAAN